MADANTNTSGEYSAPSMTAHRVPLPDKPGAFRIGSLVDPMKKQYLKMLVYGTQGAGKTTLVGSAVDVPQLRDVLVITAEGGEMVLEDNPRILNPEYADTVRVRKIEQFQKIYEFLQQHCRMRDAGNLEKLEELQLMVFGYADEDGNPLKKLPEGERLRQYHTVIIDSLTEIEAKNLDKILDLDAAGLDAGDEMPVAGFPEFRKHNNSMQRIVRAFRDLDLHVLIICAQSYNQDELKRFHYQPAMTGKLSTQIQGFVDIVGWMVVGQQDGQDMRKLIVQPHTSPKADAKNRFASYKHNAFDNPTMASIMEATGFLVKVKGK